MAQQEIITKTVQSKEKNIVRIGNSNTKNDLLEAKNNALASELATTNSRLEALKAGRHALKKAVKS